MAATNYGRGPEYAVTHGQLPPDAIETSPLYTPFQGPLPLVKPSKLRYPALSDKRLAYWLDAGKNPFLILADLETGGIVDCRIGRGDHLTAQSVIDTWDSINNAIYAANGLLPSGPTQTADYWSFKGPRDSFYEVLHRINPGTGTADGGPPDFAPALVAKNDPIVHDVFFPFVEYVDDWEYDEQGIRCTVNLWTRTGYISRIRGLSGENCYRDKLNHSIKDGFVGSLVGFVQGFVSGGYIGAIIGAVVGGISGHIEGWAAAEATLRNIGDVEIPGLAKQSDIDFKTAQAALSVFQQAQNVANANSNLGKFDPCTEWWRRVFGC